jgi:hypothetical protein
MGSVVLPVIAAGAVATAALGFAVPAAAAPMSRNVTQTVKSLEAHGLHVIVNKTGNAPLEHCVVSGVRPGHTFTRVESEIPGPSDRGIGIVTTVLAETVYLDVVC